MSLFNLENSMSIARLVVVSYNKWRLISKKIFGNKVTLGEQLLEIGV